MAGGSGDKLWPWSRDNKPKQFTSIGPRRETMLRLAYERCLDLVPAENILVTTLEEYKDHVKKLIPELPDNNLLLEPVGRHTAPCTVYSAYTVIKRDPQAVMIMMPADNIIRRDENTRETTEKAMIYAAEHDVLLAMGVIPTRPEPSYGYIQVTGGKEARDAGLPAPVKTFTEKPDIHIAEAFLKSGEFFWNSGIFVWKASIILEECVKYMPSITSLFEGWEAAIGTPAESAFLHKVYADCPKLSIDYGVMENTSRAWIYPITFKWMDLDNWEELYESTVTNNTGDDALDTEGNICNSESKLIKDCKDNIALTSNRKKMMAVRGLENFIVVDTDDVLLICPRDMNAYNEITSFTGLPDFEKFR